eukprot:UN02261
MVNLPHQLLFHNVNSMVHVKFSQQLIKLTSKCAYTTTIIADGRYSSVLSNGNFAWQRVNPITKLVEPVFRLPSSAYPEDAATGSPRGEFSQRRVARYYNFDLMVN